MKPSQRMHFHKMNIHMHMLKIKMKIAEQNKRYLMSEFMLIKLKHKKSYTEKGTENEIGLQRKDYVLIW